LERLVSEIIDADIQEPRSIKEGIILNIGQATVVTGVTASVLGSLVGGAGGVIVGYLGIQGTKLVLKGGIRVIKSILKKD